MTPFLAGFIGGVITCSTALYLLLRSDKRAHAICRALMALHAGEGVVSIPALSPVPKNTPKIMTQQEFEEVADALVGLGAKKAQAQGMVRSAFSEMTSKGLPLSVDSILRCALAQQGKQERMIQ